MEITKSQKRLLILLGLVLIYFVYDVATNWDTYAGFYSGKKTVVRKKDNGKDKNKTVQTEEQNKQKYLEKWGRNPFYKKVERKKTVKRSVQKRKIKLFLYAVSMKDNNSVALINDKVVKVGDMISGYTLQKIEKKQVVLSDGKNKLVLKLDTY